MREQGLHEQGRKAETEQLPDDACLAEVAHGGRREPHKIMQHPPVPAPGRGLVPGLRP